MTNLSLISRLAVPFLAVACYLPCDRGFAAPMELVLEKIPESRQRSNVERALKQFQSKEMLADASLLKLLSKKEKIASSNPNRAVSGNDLAMIRSIKQWIKEGGILPPCDELIDDVARYASEVAKARAQMVGPTKALATSLQRQGLHAQAGALKESLSELGKILQTSETLKEGARWVGYRQHAGSKGQVRIRITIDSMVDGQFEGRIEKGYIYAGHPVFEVSGKISGINFEARTGRKVELANRNDDLLTYTGQVVGRTIRGYFRGVTEKQERTSGEFRLDYVE